MSNFRSIDRVMAFLLPPSMQDWLPAGHLARCVVEVVDALDLREFEQVYGGRGSAAYHPAVLLALLIYGYATGVYSSRKIERATYDSVAFRYIACDQHPDHDTLASFRRRFKAQFEVFVQLLQVARENQLSRNGCVSLDGTKVHANASRHSALSWGHAEAKTKIQAGAAERHAHEQADYEAKLAARAAKAAGTGKPARGKAPKPPQAGPRANDNVNLTDEESRIMPVASGGFEQ